MEEIEEILRQLDTETGQESIQSKHQRLDDKLDEIHEQIETLNSHLKQ